MTILAVCGLRREAKIAGGGGVIAVAGGGDAAGLAAKLDAMHGDIKGVISIGIAGALSPLLQVGDVVIADRILPVNADGLRESPPRPAKPESFACDSNWLVALRARLPLAHHGALAGSDAILGSPEAKAALFDISGALAVDMESQVAARFAATRQLPLAGLRIISDDAAHTLPPAALVAMKPDGGIALGKVMLSLLRRPWQVPGLIRTARGSEKAFAELLRCRDLCGVGLAGPDG